MADLNANVYLAFRTSEKAVSVPSTGSSFEENYPPQEQPGVSDIPVHDALQGISGPINGEYYHVSKDIFDALVASFIALNQSNPAVSFSELFPVQRSVNQISFDRYAYYGSSSSPITGTLTESLLNAKVGAIAKIFYQNATLDVPQSWEFGASIEMFESNVMCILFIQYDASGFKTGNILDIGLKGSAITSTLSGNVFAIQNPLILRGPTLGTPSNISSSLLNATVIIS